MKKRMRLLTATLAVVMTMSVCAPAKAAEYDTQQQEVMQEEESVQNRYRKKKSFFWLMIIRMS